ncbi:ABC transporter permease [Desulfosoma caldarium]|uniref:Peptide/nickel transport system permease protein n=1 Tax=Desulfosoma caldarium TaxID=610254 RepID=A0A3N1UQH6_9BACT|nr:ABC transporter permease [Desulfosoma caldarium]ROQ90797.1 peptide/nickel transport system permease protein [Desulfosoma caldarium]
MSYWKVVWQHFRKKRRAMAGLWVSVFMAVVALLAPMLANDRPIVAFWQGRLVFPVFNEKLRPKTGQWKDLWNPEVFVFQKPFGDPPSWALWPPVPYSPSEYDLLENLSAPSRKHWFGTDDRGRDVLSRMIHGARISLSVGFVAVSIALVIGITLGGLAGYFGGWVDALISRLIEILLTIPTFFLIIAIIAFLPPSIYNIMVVIGLTGWTGVARFVRAEFFKLKRLDFIQASVALGASHLRIIFLHMLPNAMAPVLVSAVFGIAGAILTESSLSFLGFGVPPPTPSWGDILSQSRDYIEFAWWLTTFPGVAIFLGITAYNLVGEGLRDAMDPKLFE